MVNAAVMTSRMLLEYDGRAFAGWARQPDQRTVQAEVERALATILVEDEVPRDRRRTHRSRRARVGAGLLLRARGGRPAAAQRRPAAGRRGPRVQPGGGRVRRPRRRPLADLLLPPPQPQSPLGASGGHGPLEPAAPRPRRAGRLRRRAAGTHDFTAFTPTETDHVRFEREVFDAHWERDGDLLGFWITADTFMRHMNRVLVGTMIEVALRAPHGRGLHRAAPGRAAVRGGRDRAGAGPCARVGRLRRGSEPAAVGVGDGLRPVAHARLGEDAVDVALHRRRAHDEPVGDLLVRQPLRDQRRAPRPRAASGRRAAGRRRARPAPRAPMTWCCTAGSSAASPRATAAIARGSPPPGVLGEVAARAGAQRAEDRRLVGVRREGDDARGRPRVGAGGGSPRCRRSAASAGP